MVYQFRMQQVKHAVILSIKGLRYTIVFSHLLLVPLCGYFLNYRFSLLRTCQQYILEYKNMEALKYIETCLEKSDPGHISLHTQTALSDHWNKWHLVYKLSVPSFYSPLYKKEKNMS